MCQCKNKECREAFEKLINSIRDAAPYFLKAETGMRKRRNCEYSKSFSEGKRMMEKEYREAIIKFYKLFGRRNEDE